MEDVHGLVLPLADELHVGHLAEGIVAVLASSA